jgi:hypothetical protein
MSVGVEQSEEEAFPVAVTINGDTQLLTARAAIKLSTKLSNIIRRLDLESEVQHEDRMAERQPGGSE